MKALFQSIKEEFNNLKINNPHPNQLEHVDPVAYQASQLRDIGNQCLSQGMLDEAIMYYTKSIAFYPKCPLAFANRATAFKFKEEF